LAPERVTVVAFGSGLVMVRVMGTLASSVASGEAAWTVAPAPGNPDVASRISANDTSKNLVLFISYPSLENS
jgi:hypothetical protein